MWTRGKKKMQYERFVYPDGHEEVRSLGTSDPVLAKSICEKIRTDILMDKNFGTKRTKKKYKMSEILNKYLDHAEAINAPDTYITYKAHNRFWQKRLGHLFANNVTKAMLEDIYDREIKRVKINTVFLKFTYLGSVFNRAIDKEQVDVNPVKKMKLLEDKPERVRYLSKNEEIKLFNFLNQPEYEWLRDYVVVAIETGLRRKNMCFMTWDHVDFDAGVIHFSKQEMKGKKAFDAFMSKNVYAILYKRYQNKHLLAEQDHVFTYHGRFCKKGIKINRQTISGYFRGFIKNVVGLKNFRLHDLRHEFCSKLVQGGQDLYLVCKMAGHANIKQTQRYASLAPKQKRNALLVFDNALRYDDVIDITEKSVTAPPLPQLNQSND